MKILQNAFEIDRMHAQIVGTHAQNALFISQGPNMGMATEMLAQYNSSL